MRPLPAALALALLLACSADPETTTAVDLTPDVGPDAAVAADADDADPSETQGGADGGGADTAQADMSAADVAVEDTGPSKPACGSAAGTLPPGLVELAWDDDGKKGQGGVGGQSWALDGKPISGLEMYEAVRFDLPHPALIHGVRVVYETLPDATDAPVTIGIYPDFGHNGFDFWRFDPLWTGDRCRGDLAVHKQATFALDKPLAIAHPGLVYVAHHRQAGGDPTSWSFDYTAGGPTGCDDPNKCCDKFARCHSAWNFPSIKDGTLGGQPFYAWNGLSMSRPYDYRVVLLVEYTEQVKASEQVFAPYAAAAINTTNRQSWGDYDGDGWDDLFTAGVKLYRNVTGTLVDVTEQSGLAAMKIAGSGGVWGDYNNDGCLDLFNFVENTTQVDSLLKSNCDGTFTNATAASGIADYQKYNTCSDAFTETRAPTPAAAWVDLDGDGWLDLYLPNFICWAKESYYIDQIWHNKGDGTFEDWTGKNGFFDYKQFPAMAFAARGVNPIDWDRDGDVDLLVNNYRLHPNLAYQNQGGGKFAELATKLGMAGKPTPVGGGKNYYGHSIGTAWGDLDNDGDFDLVVANLAHPRFWSFSNKTEVLLNNGKGVMTDLQGGWTQPAGGAGLRYQETHSVPVLADFDQDGKLDLAISATYDGRPSDFYWGQGDGTFKLDAYRSGIAVDNGWGMAVADVDHDGDLDLAAKGVLLTNQLAPAKKGQWLQVRVVGTKKCNRAAIGATVAMQAGALKLLRHVSGGGGQGGQDAASLHFGLGGAQSVGDIEVDFPGAGKVVFKGPFEAGQRLWLFEDGSVHKGWGPPPASK